MQALLLHFRQHGKKAIEKVAREQPASYLKILGLLVPREHKVEHRSGQSDRGEPLAAWPSPDGNASKSSGRACASPPGGGRAKIDNFDLHETYGAEILLILPA